MRRDFNRAAVAELADTDMTAEQISHTLGIPVADVERHLDALAGVGPAGHLIDDGPIGAGHLPHNPATVAAAHRRSESASDAARVRIERGYRPDEYARRIAARNLAHHGRYGT